MPGAPPAAAATAPSGPGHTSQPHSGQPAPACVLQKLTGAPPQCCSPRWAVALLARQTRELGQTGASLLHAAQLLIASCQPRGEGLINRFPRACWKGRCRVGSDSGAVCTAARDTCHAAGHIHIHIQAGLKGSIGTGAEVELHGCVDRTRVRARFKPANGSEKLALLCERVWGIPHPAIACLLLDPSSFSIRPMLLPDAL